MIYLHGVGSYNGVVEQTQPELKAALKARMEKMPRRIDHFTQLALLGALAIEPALVLDDQTALFMTSGFGDVSVFNRVCEQKHLHNMPPGPVDFINMLSNSAGFYVASALGLKGKNLFLSHRNFTVQMTLLLAAANIKSGKSAAVLIGGVDEWSAPEPLMQRLLGVDPSMKLGEGSNWLLLSGVREGALAAIDPHDMPMDEAALERWLENAEVGAIAFSKRFDEGEALLQRHRQRRYRYEDGCGYYETLGFHFLGGYATNGSVPLAYIDRFEEHYMAIKIIPGGMMHA